MQADKPTCQLCLLELPLQKSYAGIFTRICVPCWNGQIDDDSIPIHQIHSGVYLGSKKAAHDQQILLKLQIGAILVCGAQLELHDYITLKPERKVIKIMDTCKDNIISEIPQAVKWLTLHKQANKNILIHCAGGVSRSASFCIAFFMACQKLGYKEAYLKVKRKRKCIRPNPSFVKQLQQYEKVLREKVE